MRKVVGVGSVGTRCFAVLLSGCDPKDVLILQVKEASTSVIEEVLPNSRKFEAHGERVVAGNKDRKQRQRKRFELHILTRFVLQVRRFCRRARTPSWATRTGWKRTVSFTGAR